MEELKKNPSSEENLDLIPQQEEESSFDIKTIFTLIILNWKWFLLSMFICICGALIYLRYTHAVYQLSAKMLIKEEQNNRRPSTQMLANMQDLGFMTNSAGIDNEVEILKSRILALQAVKNLKLYTEYRSNGRIRKSLIYKYQPITVDLDEEHLEMLNKSRFNTISMKIVKDGDTYTVEGTSEHYPFEGTFNTMPASLRTPYGTLTFSKNLLADANAAVSTDEEKEGEEAPQQTTDKKWTLLVSIKSPVAVAARYANGLSVAPTSKLTSIAQLTINDLHPERGFDYLKELAVVYNEQANADKNEIAYKTEEFINSRLEKINAELGSTESELEEYKRNNNLTQLRLDATQTMAQANQFSAQLADATTQIQLLDFLREHVEKAENRYQIIPSNVGLIDPISSSLIQQFNQTVQERNRMLASASENSPQVMQLTQTLDNLQSSIRTALAQARRSADIKRQGIEQQYQVYQSRVASTPEQERVLTQIGRQQEVKSGLYLMLLQKREENSISLAATADKGKLIDEPAFNGKVSPKSSIILLAALFLGFALPLLVVYLLQLLRYKIEGREDVQKLTKLPIVADVAVASESVKTAAGIVVHENQNNLTDEIFRSMRANIQFMLKGDEKVILFTSTTSGEGKTFNAANLAVSFALLGKKVILLGLDIRKPALGRLFGIKDRTSGITNLLTKDSVTLQDLQKQISQSGVNDNLDLIMAGPTPPNPTELLARKNLGEIISLLRQEYDYVILDTAPIGLVSDTLQIGKYADVTAYVCRADYTPKSSFGLVNEMAREKKLPNICIILNGVDMSKKKYGYYYGYGKYGRYGQYIYGARAGYGHYGNYSKYSESHYSNQADNSIKH